MGTVSCGQCRFEFVHGAHVCQGCRGDIVYGATEYEANEAFKVWGVLAAVLIGAAVFGVPQLLNKKFEMQIPVAFGLGFYGFGVAIVAGLAGGIYGSMSVRNQKKGYVRTFRRTSVR
jgi:hypothetical protein